MEEQKKEKTGRAKRIIKRIVLGLLLVILFFALIGLWAWKEQSHYEATAVPYLESIVPEIATWDPDVSWRYFDQDVKDTISQEDNTRIINYLSRLGNLESLDRPQFKQVTSSASLKAGMRKLVFYEISAVFENGDATINVTLTDRDGELGIYHFKVDSMAFIDSDSQDASDTSVDGEISK